MKARHSSPAPSPRSSLVALHARADSTETGNGIGTGIDHHGRLRRRRNRRQGAQARDERKSLTILINGTCSEHVVITQRHQARCGRPGATSAGPTPRST